MTPKEYENLRQGDVIESTKNGSRKVVVERYSKEAITQITKDDIKHKYGVYKIVTKNLNEEGGTC